MPILSDYTVVHSHLAGSLRLGDHEGYEVQLQFNTGGRRSNATAVLLITSKGLTVTARPGAEVRINGELCALIRPTRSADVDDWTTQLNTFPASRLHNG